MKAKFVIGLAAILAGSGVIAPVASQEITVVPATRSTEQFVADVSKGLDSELEHVWIPSRQFRGGFAQVRFRIAADGTAEQVKLIRQSGDPSVDRAALKAVRRLDPVGKLPVGYSHNQAILANIVLASSNVQLSVLNKEVARHERMRVAQTRRTNELAALVVTVSANAPS